MENIEVWKTIELSEDYEISNLGNFRSKDKTLIKSNGSKCYYKGQIIKPILDKYGYPHVGFWIIKKNGKRGKINPTVHRLVALAFISNSENKPQINHINCIKTDNMVENLEWCTNSENHIHASINGLKNTPKGELAYGSLLTEKQVLEIRAIGKTMELKEVGKLYGISFQNVWTILNYKSWKHI